MPGTTPFCNLNLSEGDWEVLKIVSFSGAMCTRAWQSACDFLSLIGRGRQVASHQVPVICKKQWKSFYWGIITGDQASHTSKHVFSIRETQLVQILLMRHFASKQKEWRIQWVEKIFHSLPLLHLLFKILELLVWSSGFIFYVLIPGFLSWIYDNCRSHNDSNVKLRWSRKCTYHSHVFVVIV